MVTAQVDGWPRPVKVHGLVNRGGWFGETWLLEVGISNAGSLFFVVEADHEQDAIDEFADSRYAHLIAEDDPDVINDPDFCSYAGNDSHPVNLDYVGLYRCKVNYFAKANSLD
jgi:hypothetical protein